MEATRLLFTDHKFAETPKRSLRKRSFYIAGDIEGVDKMLHERIQGLSTRDFEPSLRGLFGEAPPLSPSTISPVIKQFHDDYETWSQRAIANEYVYLWADGVYLGAGPSDEPRVMLVVTGVDLNDGKALLAIDDAFADSEESRTATFERLRKRGLTKVALLATDGAAGIWCAFSKVFSRAEQQLTPGEN